MNIPVLLDELNDAVTQGSAARNAEILQRITDIFVAGSSDYSDNQIELFDDVFIRLAESIELSARAVLAKRLAPITRVPSRLSRQLADDNEIAVAGPMLQHSPWLDNNTLVAAARTKTQQHLLAISRRNSLDETVTDILVERGDKPVVLSTANNPTARFSEAGYNTLVQRSESDEELAATVGQRRDIPRHHLLRLLVQASHAVRLKLEAANPAMASTIEEAIAEATGMILDRAGTGARNYTAARSHVERLRTAGRLDEQTVAELAAAKKVEETTVALSLLSHLTVEQVERALRQERPEAMLIVAKGCDLSWPAVMSILRMRAGPRGISPGELEQCHDSYSRLQPAAAKQVIQLQGNRPPRPQSRFTRRTA